MNVCIFCSVLSSKIRLGVTSWYMKPMPMIFLFCAAHDSLCNMWNFYWNPFLVIKRSNVTKACTVFVPPTFLHWLWWCIDTFKMVGNIFYLLTFLERTVNIMYKYLIIFPMDSDVYNLSYILINRRWCYKL